MAEHLNFRVRKLIYVFKMDLVRVWALLYRRVRLRVRRSKPRGEHLAKLSGKFQHFSLLVRLAREALSSSAS